ncbi:hypothetical protein KC345_g4731 [Hortaea werneckii]|nr:hypothetical protein KC345_g4731 [Hortaea werneckii]
MDSDDDLSKPGWYARILNEAYAMEKRHKSRTEDVRDHYQRLSSRLGALRQLSSTDRTLGDELLTQLFDDVEGIGKYLTHTLGENFVNGQPNEASAAKARQVFDVPELLEMILLKLPPSSIFVAQQVCQTFSALITSSSKIQHYLGLKADLQSNFSTCFNGRSVSPWSKFQCGPEFDSSGRTSAWLSRRFRDIQSEDESKPKTFEVFASFSSHSKLPRLGERCQSMLICQPPIYEMKISVACCSDDTSHHLPGMPAPPPNPELIRSKMGITTWDHDKDGFVCVAPSFKGVVHLKDGDPAMEMQKRWDKQSKDRYEARVYRQRRFSAYVQAKQQAFVAGRSIPTLAEFEAEQQQ